MDIKSDVKSAINDFIKVSHLAGTPIYLSDFNNVTIQSPYHTVKKRPGGVRTLYGFIYNGQWLKIGVADVNSEARYATQHYNPFSSNSNLAKSILNDPNFSPRLHPDEIGPWIKENCSRIDIHLPVQIGDPILLLLEAFFHVRFSPRYERRSA